MFFIIFALWLIFNGRFTVEIAAVGVAVALAICVFMHFVMGYRFKKELLILRILPGLIMYFLYLFGQVILSNLAVIKMVLSPKKKPASRIVSFETKIQSPFFRTLLANSITLTPGTITVWLKDGEYRVHCLDSSFDVNIEASGFVRRLEKLDRITGGKL